MKRIPFSSIRFQFCMWYSTYTYICFHFVQNWNENMLIARKRMLNVRGVFLHITLTFYSSNHRAVVIEHSIIGTSTQQCFILQWKNTKSEKTNFSQHNRTFWSISRSFQDRSNKIPPLTFMDSLSKFQPSASSTHIRTTLQFVWTNLLGHVNADSTFLFYFFY